MSDRFFFDVTDIVPLVTERDHGLADFHHKGNDTGGSLLFCAVL
jgi:hypothetical protein